MTPEESPFDIPDYVRAQMAEARASALEPLHRAAMWDGIKLRKAGKAPKGSFYGLGAESLDHVPKTARYLTVNPGVDLTAIADMPLEYLAVWKPADRYLPIIRNLKSLRYLRLGSASQAAIEAFGSVRTIEAMILTDCGKVESVSALTKLPRLDSFALDHIRPLTRLDDLAEARRLRVLGISGAMWTAMKVETLAPLGELSQLEFLTLVNVRVADGSIAPLARLRGLRELFLPNFFTLEEFARVVAAVPAACSYFSSGFFGDTPEQPKGWPCKKCGTPTVTTLGKPSRNLCRDCDRAKVEKHRARWQAVLAGSKSAG